MLLSRLQHLLGGIYDVRIAHDVYDFLVTDRGRLPHAARSGVADEELLVAQPADGRAEVDKYVVSYWLLRRQLPQRFPAELRRVLFERTRIDPRLGRGRAGLYREASRYAEKFCRRLEKSLSRTAGGAAAAGESGVLAE